MKKIILLIILNGLCFILSAQEDKSQIVKFHSRMRMVQKISDRTDEKRFAESSLIIADFTLKTITVHPNQFKLDKIKLMEDYKIPDKNTTGVNILCVDEKQRKCQFTAYYEGQKPVMISISFDDYDYIYFID